MMKMFIALNGGFLFAILLTIYRDLSSDPGDQRHAEAYDDEITRSEELAEGRRERRLRQVRFASVGTFLSGVGQGFFLDMYIAVFAIFAIIIGLVVTARSHGFRRESARRLGLSLETCVILLSNFALIVASIFVYLRF